MVSERDELFGRQGGVATTAQLTTLVGRAAFDTGVANGRFIQVWTGIYSRETPNRLLRLHGLDPRVGAPARPRQHTDSTPRTPPNCTY